MTKWNYCPAVWKNIQAVVDRLAVDTCSQDGTVQSAQSLGAEVYSFDDNIASARLPYTPSLVIAKWRLDCSK